MARRKDNPAYIGIDFSLTSPGIAIYMGGNCMVECLKNEPKKTPQYEPVRLMQIAQNVLTRIEIIPPYLRKKSYIFIEDYAYGGMGKTFAIAECMGIIKYNLIWSLLFPFENIFLVSIPHMKMFCCGKGTASKDTIIKEVFKRWGYDTNNNNKADAYVLMQIAKNYFEPSDDLTAFQIEALKRVKAYNEDHPNKKKKAKKV